MPLITGLRRETDEEERFQEDRVMVMELVSWAEVGQRLREEAVLRKAEGAEEATSDDGWWPLIDCRPGWAQCGVGREGERSPAQRMVAGRSPPPQPREHHPEPRMSFSREWEGSRRTGPADQGQPGSAESTAVTPHHLPPKISSSPFLPL